MKKPKYKNLKKLKIMKYYYQNYLPILKELKKQIKSCNKNINEVPARYVKAAAIFDVITLKVQLKRINCNLPPTFRRKGNKYKINRIIVTSKQMKKICSEELDYYTFLKSKKHSL